MTTFSRIADGTGADTPSVTFPSAPSALVYGYIERVDGQAASTPIDNEASAFSSFTNSLAIPTDTVNNDESLCLVASAHISLVTASWSAGWTERSDQQSSAGSVASATQSSSSGTSPSGTTTWSGSGRIVSSLVIIKPTAAGGGTPVGVASETDSALSLSSISKAVNIGLPVETDSALGVTIAKRVTLGVAAETDSVVAVAVSKRVVLGLASETNSGLSVTPAKRVSVGIASEVDTSLPLTHAKRVTVGVATSIETALGVTVSGGAADVYGDLALSVTRHSGLALTVQAHAGLTLTARKHSRLTLTVGGGS